MGQSQVSNMTFQVLANTVVGKVTVPNAVANTASSHAINAFTAAGADTGPAIHSMVGKIDGNIIGTQGVKDSGSGFGGGIRVVVQGQNTQGDVTVSNNTIREVPNATILDFFGQNGAALSGTLTARFKIINNTMPAPSGSNLSLCGPANTPCADTGIFILADQASPVCNAITGNTIYDVSSMNGSFDIFLAERIGPPAGAQLTVEGTGGSNSTYIQANNTLSGPQKFVDEGANTSQVGLGACGTFPSFAPPAEEGAIKTADGFDNKLSFLSGESRVESGEFEVPTDTARSLNTEDRLLNAYLQSRNDEVRVRNAFGDSRNGFGGLRNGFGGLRNDSGDPRNGSGDLRNVSGDSRNGVCDVRNGVGDVRNGELSEYTAIRWVSGIVDKLSDMISPTVYSQEIKVESSGKPASPDSGETVTTSPTFTLPAGKSVTIKFRATVDNGPYAAGLNSITNFSTISGSNFATFNSNTASILLDAAPDLSVVASDGAVTTQPSGVVTYVLTYKNGNAVNGQGATGVTLSDTVPVNTTFNLASSGGAGALWSCADGAAAGTVCTNLIGALAATNVTATKSFAVNVPAALPAGVIQVSNTATIAEVPLNTNGTDLNPANNTSNDTTNIIGNWLGGTSTDWFTAANWSNSVVPPTGNNVSVPNVANQPTLTTADATLNNLVLNGQNATINASRTLTVNGTVTLGTNIVSGAGTLELGNAATITRTAPTGQVNSTLKKNFNALGAFTFPVGTTGAFSPVDINVTAGAGSLSVLAHTGTAPATPILTTATTLQRYWTLNGTGITGDVTWNYLDGDVNGIESAYNTIRVSGGTATSMPNGSPCPGAGSPCINTVANTIFVSGLNSFSDWTAGALAPTAAGVSISGRIVRSDGRGIAFAKIVLTDADGNSRTAVANPFGYYRFLDAGTGQTYIISVIDKRYRFTQRVISVYDELNGLDFVPLP